MPLKNKKVIDKATSPKIIQADETLLRVHLVELLTSISNCLRAKHSLPALILIYSGIDILANLSRPKGKEKGTHKDYCKWCEKYILPNTQDIYCDSIDLYAARCAVVHSYGYKTELTNLGKARIMAYAWGDKTAKGMKVITDLTQFKDSVSHLHINKLAEGFALGIDKFFEDIKNDPEMDKLVKKRAKDFFGYINFSK